MTGTVFVDSNILIYSHDCDAGAKQIRAAAKLKELWVSGEGRLSTQVLQELCVNLRRKASLPVSGGEIRRLIQD